MWILFEHTSGVQHQSLTCAGSPWPPESLCITFNQKPPRRPSPLRLDDLNTENIRKFHESGLDIYRVSQFIISYRFITFLQPVFDIMIYMHFFFLFGYSALRHLAECSLVFNVGETRPKGKLPALRRLLQKDDILTKDQSLDPLSLIKYSHSCLLRQQPNSFIVMKNHSQPLRSELII